MTENMIEITPALILGCGLAAAFAGISKAGFGSGAAFASAAILAIALPPATALGIMLPILMLIDLVTLRPYWQQWDVAASKILIFGAIPGIALGVWVFSIVSDDFIRVLIGAVAVLFVLWQWLKPKSALSSNAPSWIGWIAGCTAGFTSFVSHAGGPPAAIYLLSKNLDKTTYQASTVLVFWAINLAKFVPYAFLGMFSLQTVLVDLLIAPFALFGAWFGVKAHHRLPEKAYFALTYSLLLITGAKLISDGAF